MKVTSPKNPQSLTIVREAVGVTVGVALGVGVKDCIVASIYKGHNNVEVIVGVMLGVGVLVGVVVGVT